MTWIIRAIGVIRGLFTTLELVEQPFHAGSLEGLNHDDHLFRRRVARRVLPAE